MRVSKWGESLAVRLPRKLVEELKLAAGDELTIVTASDKEIAIAKSDRRKEALERMTARSWASPPNYRFDRDEANGR